MDHKRIMEAALFISSSPMTIDQLARITGIHSLGHVKQLIDELQKDYDKSGLEVYSSSDGYTMQVRPKLLPRVAHLTPYSDLGEGPKRTLALVTLKEPVRQSEIIRLQGNKAYTYIKDLRKRGLVMTEKEGHTKILKLTQEFERYFGEEKAKIKEQLQRHLESAGKEGEPVYEDPLDKPAQPDPEEGGHFSEEKRPAKERARVSTIRKEARQELGKGSAEEPSGRGPEKTDSSRPGGKEEGDSGGREPDKASKETSEEKRKRLEASHDHAFKEID